MNAEDMHAVQVQNNLQDVENGGRTPKARQKINLGENDEMVRKTTFYLPQKSATFYYFSLLFFKPFLIHQKQTAIYIIRGCLHP
jgi:hypothetical protein